jgi:hypothetical protein
MGKNKKKKPKYPHVIRKDYLVAVADRICTTNPTTEIVFNTIVDVWKEGYNSGYNRKVQEVMRFREKQNKHFRDEFDQFKDYLDDRIHDKSGLPKSFDEWCAEQKELNKSNKNKK